MKMGMPNKYTYPMDENIRKSFVGLFLTDESS
jgi:hypothetical protein